jgi:hypothetical protein
VAALVAVASVAGFEVAGERADGASVSRLNRLSFYGDQFWNYDFTTKLVRAHQVDWPIGLVFYGNASINKVKGCLHNKYDQVGGPMYARLNDGGRWRWDSDRGRKTTACPGAPSQPAWARHYRIYADPDDRLYNHAWGFYVIGATHYDINECWAGRQFGWSETSEGWITYRWRLNGGWAQDDWRSFSNPEPVRVGDEFNVVVQAENQNDGELGQATVAAEPTPGFARIVGPAEFELGAFTGTVQRSFRVEALQSGPGQIVAFGRSDRNEPAALVELLVLPAAGGSALTIVAIALAGAAPILAIASLLVYRARRRSRAHPKPPGA